MGLKLNKSAGPDKVSPEHLENASSIIVPILRKCFTAMLVHGVIPSSMTGVELVPIPKDTRGNLSDKSNYRPIALASCLVVRTVHVRKNEQSHFNRA